LLAAGLPRILVTAPRLAAVAPLFHHAAAGLPGARSHNDRIEFGQGEIRFLPPDALCQGHEPADLLLVDEAAAIPAPLLSACSSPTRAWSLPPRSMATRAPGMASRSASARLSSV
jgi:tRNA(Met) C34 N-acetyltransferase TmcA